MKSDDGMRVRVEEGARFTHVAPITLRRAHARGEIPALRDYRGHRWFSLGDLLEWKQRRGQLRGGEGQEDKNKRSHGMK